MTSNGQRVQSDESELILPDLTPYWKLTQTKTSNSILLKAKNSSITHPLTPEEGFVLRYFTGKFTIPQVQKACQKQFNHLPEDFVLNLLQKLIELQILAWDNGEEYSQNFKLHKPELYQRMFPKLNFKKGRE